MKITESHLRQLIDEEITLMVENGELDEGFLDRMRAKAAGLGKRAKAAGAGLAGKAAGAVERGATRAGMGDKGALGHMAGKSKEGATELAGDIGGEAAQQEMAKLVKVHARKAAKAQKYVQKLVKDLDADIMKMDPQGTNEGAQQALDDLNSALKQIQAAATNMGL